MPPTREDAPHALPPPVIYGGFLLLAWGLDRLWPARVLPPGARHWAGGTLMFLSLAAGLWALAAFWRHRTSPLHHRPARALLTTGPFRYSRNPAYVALTLLCLGAGAWMGSLWALLLVLPAALLTDRHVIRREEAYLERRFGEEYLRYRRRVRRWL